MSNVNNRRPGAGAATRRKGKGRGRQMMRESPSDHLFCSLAKEELTPVDYSQDLLCPQLAALSLAAVVELERERSAFCRQRTLSRLSCRPRSSSGAVTRQRTNTSIQYQCCTHTCPCIETAISVHVHGSAFHSRLGANGRLESASCGPARRAAGSESPVRSRHAQDVPQRHLYLAVRSSLNRIGQRRIGADDLVTFLLGCIPLTDRSWSSIRPRTTR